MSRIYGDRFISQSIFKTLSLQTSSTLSILCCPTRFTKNKSFMMGAKNWGAGSMISHKTTCFLSRVSQKQFQLMDYHCSLIRHGRRLRRRKNWISLTKEQWWPTSDAMNWKKKQWNKWKNQCKYSDLIQRRPYYHSLRRDASQY
jgi:hypothetical protein